MLSRSTAAWAFSGSHPNWNSSVCATITSPCSAHRSCQARRKGGRLQAADAGVRVEVDEDALFVDQIGRARLRTCSSHSVRPWNSGSEPLEARRDRVTRHFRIISSRSRSVSGHTATSGVSGAEGGSVENVEAVPTADPLGSPSQLPSPSTRKATAMRSQRRQQQSRPPLESVHGALKRSQLLLFSEH